MPTITGPAFAFPSRMFQSQQAGAPSGIAGELSVSQLVGRYGTLAKAQKLFYCSAIVSPIIYSTAIQGGPMIWNRPGSGVDAHILAISIGAPTTATSVAGSIGWASNVQATAPTSPTAIVAVNAYAGGGPSNMGAINSTGTVIILPVPTFCPLIPINTATAGTAMTALLQSNLDVAGMFVVSPGNVGYACSSATLTSGVLTIGLLWAEIPT